MGEAGTKPKVCYTKIYKKAQSRTDLLHTLLHLLDTKNAYMKMKQLRNQKQILPSYSKDSKKWKSTLNPSIKLEEKLIPQEEEAFCRGLSLFGLVPQSSFLCQHYQTADCKRHSKGKTTPGVDFQNLQKKKLFQKELIRVTEKQKETICFCSRGGHVKMHQVSCQQLHNIKHCFNSSNYKGSF